MADPEGPLSQLTPREAELLKKAGERVYSLSRRLAEREREAQALKTESKSLRDLLAESHEVRRVLSSQVESLQKELDREYEERSELRRLLASLHVQMQELLPVITGLTRSNQLAQQAPAPPPIHSAPTHTNGQNRLLPALAQRLRLTAREMTGQRTTRR